MNKTLFPLAVAAVLGLSLCGCGPSGGEKPAASSPPPAPPAPTPVTAAPARPAAPAQAPPATPAAPAGTIAPAETTPAVAVPVVAASVVAAPATPAPAAPAVAVPVVSQASQVANDLGQQLLAGAKNQADGVLSSITSDLSGKLAVLGQSLAQSPAAKQQLDGAVKSLVAGKELDALSAYAKVAEAKPTAEQTKLLTEVKDLTAAYVVQKNFATLPGSEGDVAQIVSSFRKGETLSALPAIQRVSQNGQITSGQKELLGSLADKFAPGVKKAGEALQEGLKGLKAFGK